MDEGAKDDARGPATFSELSSVVGLSYLCFISSSELSALTATPTGVSCIIPGYGLVGLRNMTGEGSEEFESVELMSHIVLSGIGNDIILPAVAMLALAGPSCRRRCHDVALAKSGMESLSRARGPLLIRIRLK